MKLKKGSQKGVGGDSNRVRTLEVHTIHCEYEEQAEDRSPQNVPICSISKEKHILCHKGREIGESAEWE